ncbi:hypothetical protein [Umezawaea sp.]|uniref:hypothetical protein n=1 Tax=Umezawaea sp. TaxID=1955258 RepID=UPI002ED24375
MRSTRAALHGAADRSADGRPAHLVVAERLIDNLPADRNVYKDPSQRNVVRWGRPGVPESWTNQSQCASFITAVLRRAYPKWATRWFFAKHFGSRSPYARGYLTAFASGRVPHFSVVEEVADLKPGDLVAIDFRQDQGTNTGHIVMVREVKEVYDGRSAFAGETQYAVEVVDCTSEPHGVFGLGDYPRFPDSRIVDGTTQRTGAGYGHMMFYASDATGGFSRYRWSVNSSASRTTLERPIVAVRVDPGLFG